MNLQQRIELLEKLGNYILSDATEWESVKEKAALENTWFTPAFINLAVAGIARGYLQAPALRQLAAAYAIPDQQQNPKTVGIVMAGNIPLVGFHDFLMCWLSGQKQLIKPASKDQVLIRHLVDKLCEWAPEAAEWVAFAERLNHCDAYIATGSNQSSRYFEQYFGAYPHLIRRNRSSVALLTGAESRNDLENLADDVYQYFGLGCRNVTKIYVPRNYDFVPLLEAFKKYDYLFAHHKYKNNYDYQLAILIINKIYYMTNGSLVLMENTQIASPISQLNYEYYDSLPQLQRELENHPEIQCKVGIGGLPFGRAQQPGLTDFADAVDSLKFLLEC